MPDHTVLCIATDSAAAAPVVSSIRRAGYEPLTTDDWNQAMALYFVGRRFAAVVLDYRAKESVGMCLARSLRCLRADIPILLISNKLIDPVPKGVDACVCVSENNAEVIPALEALLQPARFPIPA